MFPVLLNKSLWFHGNRFVVDHFSVIYGDVVIDIKRDKIYACFFLFFFTIYPDIIVFFIPRHQISTPASLINVHKNLKSDKSKTKQPTIMFRLFHTRFSFNQLFLCNVQLVHQQAHFLIQSWIIKQGNSRYVHFYITCGVRKTLKMYESAKLWCARL